MTTPKTTVKKASSTAKKPVAARTAAKAKKPVAVKKPAAKKKSPAAPTRESAAQKWAEADRGFVDTVRERFAFLVRDHGYAPAEVRSVLPDTMVTFTKGDSFVRVSSEYGGVPWVVVKAWDGEPYGLHVIIAELDPGYAAQKPVAERSILTDDELRAVIAYQASFLEQHASAVLHADPALVARFHAREATLRAAR
jgi:hypothetical protein